jgi:tRNA-dihydrouridine synthase
VSTPPPDPVVAGTRPSVLAPMQDVTTTGFLRVIGRKGAPDWFVTEYFRVHESSTPEKHIVDSIVNHGTGRPVFAQLIGEDTPHMVRTIRSLLTMPVAGIDLNMGCPAPKVYRKNVGGGLLRDPAKVDELLGAMRQAIPGRFTVKMRIGFEDQRHFDALLALVAKHQVDLLTVHGRTVKGLYWSEVDYAAIAHAVRSVPCPVIANGDVATADKAQRLTAETGAHGMMMGLGSSANGARPSKASRATGRPWATSAPTSRNSSRSAATRPWRRRSRPAASRNSSTSSAWRSTPTDASCTKCAARRRWRSCWACATRTCSGRGPRRPTPTNLTAG